MTLDATVLPRMGLGYHSVDAGPFTTCALSSTQTGASDLWCWGRNTNSELTLGPAVPHSAAPILIPLPAPL